MNEDILTSLTSLETWGEFFLEDGRIHWTYQAEDGDPDDSLFTISCQVKDDITNALGTDPTFEDPWSDSDATGFSIRISR